MDLFCLIYRQVKILEEEVTVVGNNLRSLEVSEGEVSWFFKIFIPLYKHYQETDTKMAYSIFHEKLHCIL